jgi:hypothetical protein
MAKPGRLIKSLPICSDPRWGTGICIGALRQSAVHDQFGRARHGLPRRGYRVYGVVWSVPEIGLAALDIHAGVPHRHDRFGAFARTASGQLCVSEFFATRERTPGRADPAYLQPNHCGCPALEVSPTICR